MKRKPTKLNNEKERRDDLTVTDSLKSVLSNFIFYCVFATITYFVAKASWWLGFLLFLGFVMNVVSTLFVDLAVFIPSILIFTYRFGRFPWLIKKKTPTTKSTTMVFATFLVSHGLLDILLVVLTCLLYMSLFPATNVQY